MTWEVIMQDQPNPEKASGVMVHCRIGRRPGGDRISVYVGRSPDLLHLAGIVWTDPDATREVVRRLEEPGYQAEWTRYDPDDSPGTVPFPAAVSDGPRLAAVQP
jgi:hypothetical protein